MGKRVVHVNMVEVKAATWDMRQDSFRDRLGRAACGETEWPFNIVSYALLLYTDRMDLTYAICRNALLLAIHHFQNSKRSSSCSNPSQSRQTA